MKIKKLLNITKEGFETKRFNIFIGISLGNKYFSKKNITEYLIWAIKNTRDKVALLIADKINAINYEVRRGYSKKRALNVALKKGEEIERSAKKMLNALGLEKKNKVYILRWKNIENKKEYLREKKIIEGFYKTDDGFREEIIKIVKENVNNKIIKLKGGDYEKLVKYPLSELPIFIKGFKHKGTLFNLTAYPGIGRIDYLAKDIQDGKRFIGLKKKLNPKNKCIIAEVYAD